MPIQLHERLSEFSYGYGVTREFERSLAAQGLSAVPFLPSLLHEAQLGFDVGFNRVGVPLMIQFKLGQAMRRFSPGPRPLLNQPFWRFKIDTSEPDGQFELLLKAERDGADVFYVAPKFHDWEIYLRAFETGSIVRQSVIVRPSTIRETMDVNRVADGKHTVVYDVTRSYLCSDPLRLQPLNPFTVAATVRSQLTERQETLVENLDRVYDGFFNRTEIRRKNDSSAPVGKSDRLVFDIPSDVDGQGLFRGQRVERLIGGGYTREQAVGLAVAAEAWSVGAQTIFVTEK
ncbi:hypothetical protein [Agrobacterium sp. DSM 25558]|uniref:hypothetical protein n=1 Tax=Agrobacterium sp. DSM 25558 TaxID=1907665 RepID=UPI0011782555|nr:hypothetical protein [Agrobacterium sp. DSM 25558]